MRASRFLLFIGCFSCAEISGLSELGVDASSDLAATPTDALNDPSSADSFCQTTTAPYTFCADFDEGDVTKAFSSSKATVSWSSVSTPAPGLSTTAFVSNPAAALFNGDSSEALGLTPTSSNKVPASATITLSLRIDTLTGESPIIVPIPIDANQAVSLVAIAAPLAQTYKLALVDATTGTDGGVRLVSFTNTLTMKVTEWHTVSIAVSALQITLTIDNGLPTLDPRASSGPLSALQFHVGIDAKGWQAYVDNVLILIND